MVKKIILGLIVFLFVFQLVSAATTEIKVKTLPYHEVQLTPCAHGSPSFTSLGSFRETSDEYGDVVYTFDTGQTMFDLIVYVKDEYGETVISDKLTDGFNVGEPLYLEFTVGSFKLLETPGSDPISLEENETIEVESNITGNETEEIIEDVEVDEIIEETNKSGESFMTGFVTQVENIFTNKIVYYSLGMLVLIGGVVLLIVKRKSKPKEIKIRKLSDVQSEKENKLEEARRKLKEAQKEIRDLEGKDKVDAARKKLEEDKKALEDLEAEIGDEDSE